MYLCELCDWEAPAVKILREHYQQKHVRAGKTLTTRQSVAAWSKKKHACPHCDYRSNLVGHVKRHILIHTGEKPFECGHCDFKCRDKTTLRRHVNRHLIEPKYKVTDGKTYQCETCEFTTSHKGALSRHLLRHKDPTICQHCSAKFWKNESYENHVLLHAGVVLHPCRFCDYKTNFASNLKDHMNRIHTENKSWVCSECNYTTKSSSDLSKHKIIHKSDRPYACKWCEYTCKRRGHLTVHQATHNNAQKNYSCPFCNYKTILIGTLRFHVRSHTGERPFKCVDCGMSFASPAGVKAHAYTHIEDWSQSCPYCDFTAFKPHLFRKHMRIHKANGTLSTNTQNTKSPSMPRLKGMQTKQKKDIPNADITLKVKSKPPFDNASLEPPPVPSSHSPTHDDLSHNDCKPDHDVLIKSELDLLDPTCLELDESKIEDVDIFYPVKQECNSP